MYRNSRKMGASAGVASGLKIPNNRICTPSLDVDMLEDSTDSDMEIDVYPATSGVTSVHSASGTLHYLPFGNGPPTAGNSSSGGNRLPGIAVQLPGQATSGTSAPGLPAWPRLVAVKQPNEPEDMDVD